MADLFAHHPPYARWAHVLLRIVAGALLAQHGAQKLFGVLGGMGGVPGAAAPMGTMIWGVGVLEFVGGVLLFLGLLTRVVGFILSGEMAVAYFMVHAKQGFWPLMNKGELAVIFCFVFLYFAATGAGAVSLDYLLARRTPKPVMA
jgi:putative oxidoreductase